jgi:hypothetical protein
MASPVLAQSYKLVLDMFAELPEQEQQAVSSDKEALKARVQSVLDSWGTQKWTKILNKFYTSEIAGLKQMYVVHRRCVSYVPG